MVPAPMAFILRRGVVFFGQWHLLAQSLSKSLAKLLAKSLAKSLGSRGE